MKSNIHFLIYIIIAYMAYGWVGAFWSIPVGIIIWYGASEVAKRNIKQIVKEIEKSKRI